MTKTLILDCTLREGGYLNNWEFGEKFCQDFISKIFKSNIEYIEVGFLKNGNFSKDQILFNKITDINNIIPDNVITNDTKICAMINADDFDLEKIIPKTPEIKLDCIRLSFKKHQLNNIFPYLNKIKDCGYEIFVNPTYINEYSDLELIKLFDKLNEFMPDYISIVDTKGFLTENDIVRIYYLLNNHFDQNTQFCSHLHNNLYRTFENTKALIEVCRNSRNLIIDSTILGMGRAVGNLPTEQILFYLNEHYKKNYNLIPIIELLNEKIYPIFKQNPWGNPSDFYSEIIDKNLSRT